MSDSRPPVVNAVVLGGNGAMGTLFCHRLSDTGIHVTAIDQIKVPDERYRDINYLCADVRALTQEAQAALTVADLVIAALPETVLLEVWQAIVSIQKPHSLFVDTMSVKKPIVDAMSNHVPVIEVISINPMFAPSLGFHGQNVAVIEINRGHYANSFLSMLESWGAHLCTLTADSHDRYAAQLQAATHAAILAFGLSLQKLNYDLPVILPIITPPHRALLALLARILCASPEVYWDIQSNNSYATEVRKALMSALEEFSALIDEKKPDEFRRVMVKLKDIYGAEKLDEFNRYSSTICK